MTEITTTNTQLRSSGDQQKVTTDGSNIQDNYTYTVPHLRTIEDWTMSPTTEADFGGTVSGNVITIRTSSTISAKIVAYGR